MRVILVNGCLNCPFWEPEVCERESELYGEPRFEHDTKMHGRCNLLFRPMKFTDTGFSPECPLGSVNEFERAPMGKIPRRGQGKIGIRQFAYHDRSEPLRFFDKKKKKKKEKPYKEELKWKIKTKLDMMCNLL